MNYEKHSQLQELFNIVKSSTFEFQKLHWHIKGIHFKELHKYFEELYQWSFEKEDQIAELMMMLKAEPPTEHKPQKLVDYKVEHLFENQALQVSVTLLKKLLNKVEDIFISDQDALVENLMLEMREEISWKMVEIEKSLQNFK